MARSALTGTRIRERRLIVGMRQAELARLAGVSPAYLNLIEHNRRRPGAALVAAFADALGVAPEMLAEGSESLLSETLREAALAAVSGEPAPEVGRLEEFAARFPGWAALLAGRQAEIGRLERLADRLSERLAHDPQLSGQVHELLTTITALRSAATILTETADLAPDERQRFEANIAADSLRLSGAAAQLVAHLDAAADTTGPTTPQEEVESWLASRGWHLPEIESGGSADPVAAPLNAAARDLLRAWLDRAAADARALPARVLEAAVAEHGIDPARLAARLGVPVPVVMRRLATQPGPEGARIGLLVIDGAGALVLRKPVGALAIPRYGSGCPLWPLYQALGRPATPIRAVLDIAGRGGGRFLAHAWGEVGWPEGSDGPAVASVHMLLVSGEPVAGGGAAALAVGLACRICPRGACPARREPSILSGPAEAAPPAGSRPVPQAGFAGRDNGF